MFGALDGGELIPIHEARSGVGSGARIDRALGPAAVLPGFHTLRVKARLTFSANQADGDAWTETRELPPLFYAIYDIAGQPQATAEMRALGMAPRQYPPAHSIRRSAMNPLHLADVGAELDGRRLSQARTGSHSSAASGLRKPVRRRTAAPSARLCISGRESHRPDGFARPTCRLKKTVCGWTHSRCPASKDSSLERSAPESQRLSTLPSCSTPIPRSDRLGMPSAGRHPRRANNPAAGQPLTVAITARNRGTGDLFKVAIHVALATNPAEKGIAPIRCRHPRERFGGGHTRVVFPSGYGVIVVQAMQRASTHFENWTPEIPRCLRVPRRQSPVDPPRYIESVGADSGCRGSNAARQPCGSSTGNGSAMRARGYRGQTAFPDEQAAETPAR